MPVTTAVAIFFLIWWIVLFAVLPWGVRSQQEDAEVAPGTDPGAPGDPQSAPKTGLDDAGLRGGFCRLLRHLCRPLGHVGKPVGAVWAAHDPLDRGKLIDNQNRGL